MKWIGRRQSGNLEDRRGFSGGGLIAGGGIIGVIVLIIQLFMGGDPEQLVNTGLQNSTNGAVTLSKEDEEMGQFVGVVLADNEDVWNKLFAEMGKDYEEPKLVLYRRGTESGCGMANSAVGPFYCPADHKVYMDLSFFDDLKNRFGAKGGDFAIAYVIAHEVGHHVQNLLGTFGQVQNEQRGLSQSQANKLSVSVELQADFYAGVWAHHAQQTKNILESGDIEEALSAASAVGDDHLQKQSQGYVVPDAFTHGTSEQRVYWFKRGFETGDLKQGNTFSAKNN
jgi:predicted metalloprotease